MSDIAFHSPDHPYNQKFVNFARREIGARVRIENCSRDFGRPSIVWRLTADDGSRTWLKHHEDEKLFQRELIGLEHYVPALGAQPWWSSPALVAKDAETNVMLMTDVEGEALNTIAATADEEWTMFRLAAKFIRRLHALESCAPDASAATPDLRHRLENYLTSGLASIDDKTRKWTQGLIDQACAAGPIAPVACHRDFSPRNWLMAQSPTGIITLGVIDWERSGQDLWLYDAQRMVYDHWHDKPQLREAYFEGYGRQPTAAEQLQLDAICLVGAIASIPWAQKHRDTHFATLSREIIARIQAQYIK
ncbi:MAG: aminoglycoside phosphotransferase family protein [Rhizobiaceae bacterium]|nr:aminoglycoside phosphotransferase family protein [Rhizobiaceae bacterium]